jgi:hypothetical protein
MNLRQRHHPNAAKKCTHRSGYIVIIIDIIILVVIFHIIIIIIIIIISIIIIIIVIIIIISVQEKDRYLMAPPDVAPAGSSLPSQGNSTASESLIASMNNATRGGQNTKGFRV